MEPNTPLARPEDAGLAQAQARANQLLDALRLETARLPPDADSALTFRPDPEQLEAPRE
jgi:hypothetical protein